MFLLLLQGRIGRVLSVRHNSKDSGCSVVTLSYYEKLRFIIGLLGYNSCW